MKNQCCSAGNDNRGLHVSVTSVAATEARFTAQTSAQSCSLPTSLGNFSWFGWMDEELRAPRKYEFIHEPRWKKDGESVRLERGNWSAIIRRGMSWYNELWKFFHCFEYVRDEQFKSLWPWLVVWNFWKSTCHLVLSFFKELSRFKIRESLVSNYIRKLKLSFVCSLLITLSSVTSSVRGECARATGTENIGETAEDKEGRLITTEYRQRRKKGRITVQK